jgi:hypothetical protein
MQTDHGGIQLVFTLSEQDLARFQKVMSTRKGETVERFKVRHLNVIVRRPRGNCVLQEESRFPWNPADNGTTIDVHNRHD